MSIHIYLLKLFYCIEYGKLFRLHLYNTVNIDNKQKKRDMMEINYGRCEDVCTTDGLQKGLGAVVSDKDTFGCRNPVCSSGVSPGYHIILLGNNRGPKWQRVEVDLQKGCDRSSLKYERTVLVLMSGYPVHWVITGFSLNSVYLIGEGSTQYTSDEIEFEQYDIPNISYNVHLRRNILTDMSGKWVMGLIDTLQKNNFETFGGDEGWPFNHEEAASVNYAWKATSWTLTVGEYCCLTSTIPTKVPTQKPPVAMTVPIVTSQPWPTTTAWLNKWTTTTSFPDVRRTEFPTEFPISNTEESGSSAAASGIAGIAAGAGTIILVLILTIIITIICCSCRRKGKRASTTTTSQNTQLNTVQGSQNIESGTTPQFPSTAGVNYFGAVHTQHAPPNVQSHPTPIDYPTGGPQPSAGPTGLPEQPPPYNDIHPTKPPSYSQVIREHNGPRVAPSAPALHK